MTAIDDISPAPWHRLDWGGELISIDDTPTDDFTREDVLDVVAFGESGDEWDGSTIGIVRLGDGRFAAWEASYGPTGNGFVLDAYGGDSNIYFARTACSALLRISDQPAFRLIASVARFCADHGTPIATRARRLCGEWWGLSAKVTDEVIAEISVAADRLEQNGTPADAFWLHGVAYERPFDGLVYSMTLSHLIKPEFRVRVFDRGTRIDAVTEVAP